MQRRAAGQGCKLLHPGPTKLNLNLNPEDGGEPEKAFKERMRSDLCFRMSIWQENGLESPKPGCQLRTCCYSAKKWWGPALRLCIRPWVEGTLVQMNWRGVRESQFHLLVDSRWMCQTMQFWKHTGWHSAGGSLGAEMPRWALQWKSRRRLLSRATGNAQGVRRDQRGGMDESSRGGEVLGEGRKGTAEEVGRKPGDQSLSAENEFLGWPESFLSNECWAVCAPVSHPLGLLFQQFSTQITMGLQVSTMVVWVSF